MLFEVSAMFDLSLRICVRLAAVTVLLGWILSALHCLRSLPYLGLLGVGLITVVLWTCRSGPPRSLRIFRLRRFVQRRRFLPQVFILVFTLSCIGAVLYAPNNFDALSYRVPRVLYWLTEGGWHWVDTPYFFLNCALPNFEWLSLPALVITGDVHADVIINLTAFLFTPGLFFSLLRQFGVASRLAFDWMWLFPTSYLVAMQAGGLGNDLIGLTMILASLYFAGRFAKAGHGSDLFDALIAVGFCTGIKLSNLPLGVFTLILLLKKPSYLAERRTALIAGMVCSVSISAFIPMILNFVHSGSILGTTTGMVQVDHPAAGIIGNSLIMAIAALSPPILPQANALTGLLERGLGESTVGWLKAHYANFTLKLNELPQEEA